MLIQISCLECQDSNSQSLNHGSPTITTGSGLLLFKFGALGKWRCTTRHYYYLSGLLAFCSFFEEIILFIPMLLDTYFKLRARKASYKTNWSGVRALAQKGNAFLTWI